MALGFELRRGSLAGLWNLAQTYVASNRLPERPRHDLTILQIETTLLCNLECKMCFRDFGEGPKPHMTIETFRRVVSQFPYLRQVNLTGNGEPLINKDTYLMVEHSKALGQFVRLTSNGTMLTEANSRRLIDAGLDEIRVSIDGGTEETYNDIRVKSDFRKLRRNLERFQALKREMGRKRPEMEFATVLMKDNLRELPDLVDLAHDLGVERIWVGGLDNYDYGFAKPDHMVDGLAREEVDDVFRRSREHAERRGVFLRLPELDPKPQGCPWPWVTILVTYKGEVLPCCKSSSKPDRQDTIRDYSMGNLVREDWRAIWHGDRFRTFRRDLAAATAAMRGASNGRANGHANGQAALPRICLGCSVLTGTM